MKSKHVSKINAYVTSSLEVGNSSLTVQIAICVSTKGYAGYCCLLLVMLRVDIEVKIKKNKKIKLKLLNVYSG